MAKKKQSVKSKRRAGSSAAKLKRLSSKKPTRKLARRPTPKRARKAPLKRARAAAVKASKPPKRPTPRRASARPASSVTAAQILNLGSVSAARMNAKRIPTKWTRHYKNLRRLRDELLMQSGQLARDAHEESVRHSMHMADSGTDSFDRDFALSLLSADQEAIREIEEAMKRIENGTYGICELTGKAIAKARLEAIPWTRFSYEAQCRLEKEGSVNHTHLGTLGSIYATDNWETGEGEEEEEEQQPAASEKS